MSPYVGAIKYQRRANYRQCVSDGHLHQLYQFKWRPHQLSSAWFNMNSSLNAYHVLLQLPLLFSLK